MPGALRLPFGLPAPVTVNSKAMGFALYVYDLLYHLDGTPEPSVADMRAAFDRGQRAVEYAATLRADPWAGFGGDHG